MKQARRKNTSEVRTAIPVRTLLAALTALSLVASGWMLWQTGHPGLQNDTTIRSVQIQGSFRHLSTESLQQAVARVIRDDFFGQELAVIRDALLSEPWIAEASVRREWPGRLTVQVTEHQPVAIWDEGRLLSRAGVVFDADPASVSDRLPRLFGPEGSHQLVLQTYQVIASTLAPLRLQPTKVRLNDRYAWSVQLNESVEVIFGREDLTGRLQRLLVYLRTTEHTDAPKAIDLRYPNGLAVLPAEEQPAAGERHG